MQVDILGAVWSDNGPMLQIVKPIGAQRAACLAVLNAEQPYLDHHRPGGDPVCSGLRKLAG
jgi:hypothetical protein